MNEKKYVTEGEQNIDFERLGDSDLLDILGAHEHIKLFGDETREELEQILRLNIDNNLVDEIEIITILDGK